MTISMSQVQTIRQLKREGETVAGISRKVGVSRDTVYKHLEKDDFSLAMPVRKPAKSIMDEYRAVIESYFEEDARSWRNQAAQSGYSATVGAMSDALASTGRIDEASVAVAAARAASGSITYDEPVDLGAYDRALSMAKGA